MRQVRPALCTRQYADTPERRYSCIALNRRGTLRTESRSRRHSRTTSPNVSTPQSKTACCNASSTPAPHAFAPTVDCGPRSRDAAPAVGQERDDGLIDSQEWQRRRNRINRRSSGDRTVAAGVHEIDLAALHKTRRSFRTIWDGFTMRQRRTAIRVLTRDITVTKRAHRNHQYDPNRVNVTWRA